MAVSKSTLIPIDDDWYIETGYKHNPGKGRYYYLLHRHGRSNARTKHGLTIPNPDEHSRVCAECHEKVPPHVAGLLILCRWEA